MTVHRSIARLTDTYIGFTERTRGLFVLEVRADYGNVNITGPLVVFSRRLDAPGGGFSPDAARWIKGFCDAAGVQRWEDVAGRTVLIVWDDVTDVFDKALGVEPLPTEPGTPFMFDEVQGTR